LLIAILLLIAVRLTVLICRSRYVRCIIRLLILPAVTICPFVLSSKLAVKLLLLPLGLAFSIALVDLGTADLSRRNESTICPRRSYICSLLPTTAVAASGILVNGRRNIV